MTLLGRRFVFILLVLIAAGLGSNVSLASKWQHVTIDGLNGSVVIIDYTKKPCVRGILTGELWINIRGAKLPPNSDDPRVSKIEAIIKITDESGVREEKVKLAYHPWNGTYTWYVSDPLTIYSETVTGCNVSPKYSLTIQVSPPNSAQYLLVDNVPFSFDATPCAGEVVTNEPPTVQPTN